MEKRIYIKPDFKWDPLAGAGYIKLKAGKVARTKWLTVKRELPYIITDYDKKGNMLGIEIVI